MAKKPAEVPGLLSASDRSAAPGSPGALPGVREPLPPPVRSAHSALPKLALSLLLAGGFIWVLQRGGLPIVPPEAAFAGVAWWWTVPAYLSLCCLGIFLRTYRWVYLLRPLAANISSKRVLGSGLVGFAVVFFAPLRTGELARPWLIARRGEVSFLQATGTIAAERVIDGLAVTLVLAAGLLLSTPIAPLPDHVGALTVPVAAIPAAAYASFVLFFGATLMLLVLQRWRARVHRILRWSLGLLSHRLAEWTMLRVEKLADGLTFVRSGHTAAFLRDTVLYWAVMLLCNWVLLRGCGVTAGLAEAGVIMGVVGLGSLIPSGPGFFGTFQLASYAALAMFFAPDVVLVQGSAFTFLSYSTQVSLTILSCLVGLRLIGQT